MSDVPWAEDFPLMWLKEGAVVAVQSAAEEPIVGSVAKRVVFVGSSHEGWEDAELTCKALKESDSTVEPRLWKEFFAAGSLTFEALEDMLNECCGALFVVRPDDIVRHATAPHAAPAKMPRGNVLLEFGLVAGRLGRTNVALCQFDKAALPSDLTGMTIIEMDREGYSTENRSSRAAEAREKLSRWSSRLLSTGRKVARTALFHGYTGQWEFQLQLNQWHSFAIEEPSHAVVNGTLSLFISPDGEGGHGFAEGILSYHLDTAESRAREGGQPYRGDLHLIHKIEDVECCPDGSIRMTTHTQGVYPINEGEDRWPEIRRFTGTEPWTFKWTLKAGKEARTLSGSVETSAAGGTTGQIGATQKRRA